MSLFEKKYTKVRFDGQYDNQQLKNKTCVLLVSVGQKYHEDDKLLGTIDLINRSGFSFCLVAVADTLQRHNFLDKSIEQAYYDSLKSGDEWLIRNSNALSQLRTETKILRWDEALQDQQYHSLKEKIDFEYKNNKCYRDAVNFTILTFTERAQKRDADFNFDLTFNNCLKYLIEEIPIIMPLWAAQGYDFIIYPKPMTTAMSKSYDLFVKDKYRGKASWLSLKFKKVGYSLPNSMHEITQAHETFVNGY